MRHTCSAKSYLTGVSSVILDFYNALNLCSPRRITHHFNEYVVTSPQSRRRLWFRQELVAK